MRGRRAGTLIAMDPTSAGVVAVGLQALGGAAAGIVILLLYRYVRQRSTAIGAVFAAGLLARLVAGLLLFSISYFDLPVLTSLHSSDGYWVVAPDARGYTNRAARAAEQGLSVVRPGSASPTYVKILAVWMRGAGGGPASGLYLNVLTYALLCAFLVAVWKPRDDWRHDAPCLLACATFSFAPGALFHSTQALKDDVFAFLIAGGAVGAFFLLDVVASRAPDRRGAWAAFGGLAALAAAFYAIAGIRAYYAIIMWACLGFSLGVAVLRPDWKRLRRGVPMAGVVLALTAVAWWEGSGAYNIVASVLSRPEIAAAERSVSGAFVRARELVSRTGTVIVGARGGFARSGGATNMSGGEERRSGPAPASAPGSPAPPGTAPAPVPTDASTSPGSASGAEVMPESAAAAAPAGSPRPADPTRPAALRLPEPAGGTLLTSAVTHARRLVVGLGALFVPVSLLRAAGVEVSGGRGLLFLTDLDTLFVDAAIVGVLAFLWSRRQAAARHVPYVAFVFSLGVVTALLLAYVVTNFGTLFRLRMMATVPLWLLVLATGGVPRAPADNTR